MTSSLRQYKKINPKKPSIVIKYGIVVLYSWVELMQLNVRFVFLSHPPLPKMVMILFVAV